MSRIETVGRRGGGLSDLVVLGLIALFVVAIYLGSQEPPPKPGAATSGPEVEQLRSDVGLLRRMLTDHARTEEVRHESIEARLTRLEESPVVRAGGGTTAP